MVLAELPAVAFLFQALDLREPVDAVGARAAGMVEVVACGRY